MNDRAAATVLPGADERVRPRAAAADERGGQERRDPRAARFTGTAVLTAQQARDLGTLGYVARASGLDIDARRDHPTGILTDDGRHLGDLLTVPTHTGGDVLARFQQRAAEIDASLAVLDTLVRTVTPGTIHSWPTTRPADPLASGVGIVESWRGTIVHRVETGPDQRLTRVKIVDPSFFNWPALPVALAGTIVPDFPWPTRASTSPTPATTCSSNTRVVPRQGAGPHAAT